MTLEQRVEALENEVNDLKKSLTSITLEKSQLSDTTASQINELLARMDAISPSAS